MKMIPDNVKQYLSIIDKYVATSITDVNGVVLYVSEAFCELCGYSKDELIGKTHSIHRHPDMQDSTYKELWETIEAAKPWSGRIVSLKQDNSTYFTDIHIEPIFKNNETIAYMAIRRNVTNEALYEKLAHTDSLTTLHNRASIENFATTFIAESKRHNYPFSTIMIDLDNFKEVNDTFGHQAGDVVLKKVAQIATTLMRSNDRMGRFGGEEFVILLPQTSYDQAKKLAERLRKGVSIYHFDGVGSVTASFGVASFEEDDTFFSLITRADKALYRAKEMGKNQVC